MTALSATFSIAAALKNEKGRTFLPGLQPFQKKYQPSEVAAGCPSLLQILLVIFLGAIKRAGRSNLRRDRAL
jgi:hypothetical protein